MLLFIGKYDDAIYLRKLSKGYLKPLCYYKLILRQNQKHQVPTQEAQCSIQRNLVQRLTTLSLPQAPLMPAKQIIL
ncbi:hypothetical protein FGO68_gene9973 [Halteria grandinella]|uniref:Uncharacterized protein n=1 Tax=Halteria grandinella TaxID=5974 RepID=A0A8J8T458_HALGN|nr:hypothetical protein FGO68_gene9973 [Halteria grandinella]